LQRYLVDKQDDDNFLKVDLATSLLETEGNNLSEEQKDILGTVKKINVVAYPLKTGKQADYETEKQSVKTIIASEEYKTLSTMTRDNMNITLKYMGEETAIDEVIVFASDDEKGFAVFRLLSDDMRPDQMLKLVNSLESGDLDLNKLSGIGKMFGDTMDIEIE